MFIDELRKIYQEGNLSDFLHKQSNNSELQYFFARLAYIITTEDRPENINVKQDVIDLISDSIIDELPKEEPECMKRRYCIKCSTGVVNNMSEVYLCRYNDDDPDNVQIKEPEGIMYFCLGCTPGVGAFTSNFVINWKEGKIYTGESKEAEDLNGRWNDNYVKFLITFAFMYNAVNSPLIAKKTLKKFTRIQHKSGIRDIENIFVTVDEAFKKMAAGIVHVRGHLRNQACGVQWSDHRIIYIAPFEYERMLIKKD